MTYHHSTTNFYAFIGNLNQKKREVQNIANNKNKVHRLLEYSVDKTNFCSSFITLFTLRKIWIWNSVNICGDHILICIHDYAIPLKIQSNYFKDIWVFCYSLNSRVSLLIHIPHISLYILIYDRIIPYSHPNCIQFVEPWYRRKKHLRRVPALDTLRFHENFYARYVSARVELIYLVHTEFLWDCKGVVPCILEVVWATLNKLLTECCCDVRVTPRPIVTRPWCFSRINSIYKPVKKYFATVSPYTLSLFFCLPLSSSRYQRGNGPWEKVSRRCNEFRVRVYGVT